MQDKDTTKSTFDQLFEPIFNKQFSKQIESTGDDKYVKKLKTTQLIAILAQAQLEKHQGLRDISNSLNKSDLSQAIGLDSISASQISRRLRDLKTKTVQALFKSSITELSKNTGFHTIRQQLGRLCLIDSSTIILCLSKYPWAEFRKTKGGVKLHLRLCFENEALPDDAVITSAKKSDKTQMDALVVKEKGALNVVDRGYVDYKKFDNYCENGTRFVTRLKSNAIYEVVADNPVDPSTLIKKDQIIYLGAGNNRMKHPLRLIETEDTHGKPVVIVTNDFNLNAVEIGDIYRHRWQIELFFKWIKQHLHVKHLYGTSQQAVENQIFIALITYCLLVLLKLKTGYNGRLLDIKRLLDTCLYEPFTSFVKKLYRDPQRTSRGRRRIDHEAIYQETVRQVMAGETDYLYTLTYDLI